MVIKKYFQNTFYALSSKPTKQKLLFIGLTTLILIGIYFLWNKIQVEQCERLMTNRGWELMAQLQKGSTDRTKVIGDKVFFCIKKLYGIDPDIKKPTPFTRPFPLILPKARGE